MQEESFTPPEGGKNLYEERKREKNKQSHRRDLLKSSKKVFVWIVVILTITFTGAGVFLSLRGNSSPDSSSIENLVERYPDQGGGHIAVGVSHPSYNSNPPTSGWHYAQEAEWGIYEEELPDEQIVHNLEHCGIWISYQPNISRETKENLASFVKKFPAKVILTPRAANDSPIVLTSWGILFKLSDYDEAKILAFVAAFLNKTGPECQVN